MPHWLALTSEAGSLSSMLKLRRVETPKDWDQFIEFQWSIYKGDPNWVPQLRMATRDLLDVNKNPFFRHADLYPILAERDGKIVGRIIGVIDENHNRFHEELVVFFGFFECVDDRAVAQAMLDEVAKWGRARGMKQLRGPMNPSMNHECGLLVEGFEDSPSVMMTYNPPYYAKLLEEYGLGKAKDLYAYSGEHGTTRFSDRLLAQAERLRQRSSISFRPLNLKKFKEEVQILQDIYNDAWEKNWGFVPMTPEEFQHMAKDLGLIVDPELCLVAEINGKPVGFSLALPDVNLAFKKVPDGKLFPFGVLKLLWHLKGPARRRTVNRLRIVTLGIRRDYQTYSIGPLLYTEYLKRGPERGYVRGEAGWILEDNRPMNRALEHMSFKRTKTYRIFEKALS